MRLYFFSFLLFSIFSLSNVNASTSDEKEVVADILKEADIQINGNRPWDIKVHNEDFYHRVLKEQSLGLGESYMEGWWDCDALDDCFYRITRANLENTIKPTWKMRWTILRAKLTNRQDKLHSMKVIETHYQLGNTLFEKMLDKQLTYSCGYWNRAQNLDDAQVAKFDLIAKKLGLKKGMKVLDIGCGWGGFAKFIAEKYGVEVVAITLSTNQAEHARIVCQGLPVDVRVQDYRDISEKFDRVVEIGMFEHVGAKNYRNFMETAYRCLKDDGLVMIHTIGRNSSSVVCDPWINKYIFPDGNLPSIKQIGESIEGLFVMEDWHNFGSDYDKTLLAWFVNFDKNWDQLKESYPADFYRMWKYYLLACAGAFRAREIQLWQVVLSKGGVLGGYQTVR